MHPVQACSNSNFKRASATVESGRLSSFRSTVNELVTVFLCWPPHERRSDYSHAAVGQVRRLIFLFVYSFELALTQTVSSASGTERCITGLLYPLFRSGSSASAHDLPETGENRRGSSIHRSIPGNNVSPPRPQPAAAAGRT